jgi:hypothetical protein
MTLAAVGVIAVVLVPGSSANLSGSTFEGNDGNLVVDTSGNHDWVNAPNISAGKDLATGTQDNSFGQGTKEDNVNVTVVNGSIPNSKADLARFAVAGETVGANNFLYLAWSRENLSGTVNFDFEINQKAQPDLTTAGAKTLVRTQGDLLITYDFAGGSNTPSLNVRVWGSNNKWGSPSSLAGCSEGATNGVQVSENLGGFSAVNRPPQAFGEAAINLTSCGITPSGSCEGFASAYVKSRASTSFTSEVKDFIAPVPTNFSNCGAIKVVKTRKHAADGTGDHPQSGVTFTIHGTTTTAVTDDDGVACFNGLALNQTYTIDETVPDGYVSDDDSQDATLTTSGTCSSGATELDFHNTPLTDLTVSVDSQVDGGTASTIDCSDASSNPVIDASTDTHGDGSGTATDLQPGTYTCTVVIDP